LGKRNCRNRGTFERREYCQWGSSAEEGGRCRHDGTVERCLWARGAPIPVIFFPAPPSSPQPAFVVRPSRSFFSFLSHRSFPSVLSQVFVESIIIHRRIHLFDGHSGSPLVNGHAASHRMRHGVKLARCCPRCFTSFSAAPGKPGCASANSPARSAQIDANFIKISIFFRRETARNGE
jgi:hypothetical protein